jgi:oxygen-independent coproporphyrinogen III oxidase
MIGIANQPVRSVYVHVPFCAKKCDYCAFYSEPGNATLMERYVDALIREMETVGIDAPPRTLFFGGGTPSLLPIPLWNRLITAMQRLGLTGSTEWTVECNPATVSTDKARFLIEHGVNRVSLGVQSLDDALLDRLGRVHSRDAVFQSFDLLRRAGFDNVNLDLMFAIPGQTLDTWRRTLVEAMALGSEHLACYEVIYEEDTPLYFQLAAGRIDVDEDLACAMYDELLERADAHGLRQYEIANFARHSGSNPASVPDRACQHNVNYWRGGSFHGFGPSASAYLNGVRTRNCSNTPLYCERLEHGQPPIEVRDILTPLGRAGETAAFGLRMNTGWRFDDFETIAGFDLRKEWAQSMADTVARGWGRIAPDNFRLTAEGMRFADAAAEAFLR